MLGETAKSYGSELWDWLNSSLDVNSRAQLASWVVPNNNLVFLILTETKMQKNNGTIILKCISYMSWWSLEERTNIVPILKAYRLLVTLTIEDVFSGYFLRQSLPWCHCCETTFPWPGLLEVTNGMWMGHFPGQWRREKCVLSTWECREELECSVWHWGNILNGLYQRYHWKDNKGVHMVIYFLNVIQYIYLFWGDS
jgi:hypothetical protein